MRTAITLKIYNGTKTPGLAESLSERFRHFGFKVQPVDRKKTSRATTDAVAVITYGPKTVAAAQVVRAYFLMTDPSTDSNMQFSLKNTSPVVTVTIGSGYRQLGAPTEVHQAIAALGTPAAPPGTCADRSEVDAAHGPPDASRSASTRSKAAVQSPAARPARSLIRPAGRAVR